MDCEDWVAVAGLSAEHNQVERITRLIRSKGVGVYYVTQSPADVPDRVSAQLGNRVHHAMRAFTPKELKAIKVAAQTMRTNRRARAAVSLPRARGLLPSPGWHGR